MFFKLFKIFLSNIFSFDSIVDGFKKGIKGITKSVLLILLFLYVICCFGGMYISVMISAYKMLESSGQVYLMPVVSFLIIFLIIIFFGFTSVAANYYTNSGEEQFLSMPISSSVFFGAKFSVSFVTDAVIGIILFSIANFVYAANVGLLKNPFFYIGVIISSSAISLLVILLIYILLILPLYFFRALRKKSFLTGLASFFIIVFALFYGLFSSKMSSSFVNGDLQQISQPILNFSAKISQKYPFLFFIADAINGNFFSVLFLLFVSLIIVFVFVPTLSRLYIKTLDGFSDIKTKKLSQKRTTEVLKKDLSANSVFKALFIRDVRLVLREPSFFANGPLLIFLFPIILIVSFGIGFVTTMENPAQEFPHLVLSLKEKIADVDIEFLKYCISVGGAVFVIFIGNMASVAITSFSREGKSLFDLKAMPIKNDIIVKAKFWHAFLYIFIADFMVIVFLIVLNLIFSSLFTFINLFSVIFYMSLNAFAVSVLLILCDMFVDTVNPKLLWENPVAAFKQNLNTLAGFLLNIVIISILIVLVIFVLPKNQFGQLILTFVFVIISAPVGAKYFKYAEKRISLM